MCFAGGRPRIKTSDGGPPGGYSLEWESAKLPEIKRVRGGIAIASAKNGKLSTPSLKGFESLS
jgi:hypothetical protein